VTPAPPQVVWEPGNYRYFSQDRQGMRGEIIVPG